MKFAVPLACVSLLALAACATSPDTSPAALDALLTDSQGDGSAYGLFLSGAAAVQDGDNATATRYFTEAARVSGSPEVREEAFFTSVLSGDIQSAAKLAPQVGAGSPGAVRLGRLVKAVDAMAENNGRDALAALSGEPVGYPHRAAAALLKPWVAATAGDWAAATAEPELKSDRLAFNLGSLAQAQLLEKSRRYPEAEATLKTMSAQGDTGGIFMEAYGAFLERRGRYAEALAVYDAALAKAPTDRSTLAARGACGVAQAPPPIPEPRIGAANAMIGAAAGAMLMKQSDISLIYLRLALRLDPKADEAWMLLGDTFNVAGDTESARTAYDRVSPKSSGYVEARSRVIWTFQGAGEGEVALRMAQETVRLAPGSALAQTTLADVLRANKRYAESAQVLDGVIATAGDKADWRLYYLRALARDKAGRWADAESDLLAGLNLKPDEAELLNYLGYSWIDRGERLDQALEMIKKALASEPDSGAIVDSLGWAYFRLGQYDKAVEQLERAAQLEPIDAEINNHLGDAYWRVGRRIEAEFQWRKVLTTMSPTEEMKADLERKLKTGLQAVAPAKVATR